MWEKYSTFKICLLILEREALIGCLRYVPRTGMEPATQVCALTRNWTPHLLAYGIMLQPPEPHWPGPGYFYSFLPLSVILLWTACSQVAVPLFLTRWRNWVQSQVTFTLTCSSALLKPLIPGGSPQWWNQPKYPLHKSIWAWNTYHFIH